MPDNKRVPSPIIEPKFRLGLRDSLSEEEKKAQQYKKYSFGLPPLEWKTDSWLTKTTLSNTLANQNLSPVWDFLLEHGHLVPALPFEPPPSLPKIPSRLVKFGDPKSNPRLIFEIPPLDDLVIQASQSLSKFASMLGLDTLSLRGSRLWIVYENDGSLPFNPGSGSDQGPTAFLGIYLTFDEKSTGLTRIGWTVIDMWTPRGTLPPGASFSSKSQYQTPSGPYSGVSSIDFTVTVAKTGLVKVDILGAVGVDSTRWGKFVQDFIHQNISNSPLFPWPKDPAKFFAQGGGAVLVTPNFVVNKDEYRGITYEGKIEFGGKLTTGTVRTEAMVDARYVLRTSTVKTALGDITLEFSPLGVVGRGFLRYETGRETMIQGVEGGFKANAMVKIGKLGIGVAGDIILSTDPALQTNNPAGSRPLLSPLKEALGDKGTLGGPAGHHGTGQIVLTWTF